MATVAERLVTAWEPPRSVYSTLASVDHKVIGKRYLATAFVFLIVGGLEAAVIRAQLTRSNEHLLSPEAYNQLFTMHGLTMIFWYAFPILSGPGSVATGRRRAAPRSTASCAKWA